MFTFDIGGSSIYTKFLFGWEKGAHLTKSMLHWCWTCTKFGCYEALRPKLLFALIHAKAHALSAFLIASISLSCRRLCSWTRLTRLCPLCLMVMTRLVWLSRDTSMSWAPCALKNSSLWSLSNIKSDLRSHQDVGWVVLNQVCRHDLSPDEARAVHD